MKIVVCSVIIVGVVLAVIFFPFISALFALEDRVEITESIFHSSTVVGNHRLLTVDVSLFNHGWSKIITVWAEVTDQPTQVSYSKAQTIHLGFRESTEATIEFTLDSSVYQGEFTYRVWLTYPEKD